jgi:hypothetical protein
VTYQRLPYEDASPTPEMAEDCQAVRRALARPVPRLRIEDSVPDVPREPVSVTEGTSRLAAGIHPYLD